MIEVSYDSLLENAVRYFSDSVAFYQTKSYKNAVTSLWSGVLLLLKCKLYKVHPALICSNLEKLLELKDGNLTITSPDFLKDFQTVNLNEMEKRFRQLKIGNEVYERYKNDLKNVQKARNQAEHCVCTFSEDDLLKLFETSIPFINDFLEEELNTDPVKVFHNWSEFLSIRSLAEARKKNVEIFIDENINWEDAKAGRVIIGECSECGADSIDIGDGLLTCKNCGNKEKYAICSECGNIFTGLDYDSFVEEANMCYECFQEKSGMLDED